MFFLRKQIGRVVLECQLSAVQINLRESLAWVFPLVNQLELRIVSELRSVLVPLFRRHVSGSQLHILSLQGGLLLVDGDGVDFVANSIVLLLE